MSGNKFSKIRIDHFSRYGFGVIVTAFLMLMVSGCYYDEVEALDPEDIVSFAADLQPILTNNCTSCHPVLVTPPDLTEGNAYDAMINGVYIVPEDLENSELYQRLLGNPSLMPPSGSLPAFQIQLFEAWIEQGALDN